MTASSLPQSSSDGAKAGGAPVLHVFALRDSVVDEYKRFAMSFTTIQAQDIREQVAAIYAEDRYWPEPLIQINPSYRRSTDVAPWLRTVSYTVAVRTSSVRTGHLGRWRIHQSSSAAPLRGARHHLHSWAPVSQEIEAPRSPGISRSRLQVLARSLYVDTSSQHGDLSIAQSSLHPGLHPGARMPTGDRSRAAARRHRRSPNLRRAGSDFLTSAGIG